jgi:hypothetical protein
MKNPPNFIGWVILKRYGKGYPFLPHATERGGFAVRLFRTRKEAEQECRQVKEIYGRGNSYVQQYGPIS